MILCFSWDHTQFGDCETKTQCDFSFSPLTALVLAGSEFLPDLRLNEASSSDTVIRVCLIQATSLQIISDGVLPMMLWPPSISLSSNIHFYHISSSSLFLHTCPNHSNCFFLISCTGSMFSCHIISWFVMRSSRLIHPPYLSILISQALNLSARCPLVGQVSFL